MNLRGGVQVDWICYERLAGNIPQKGLTIKASVKEGFGGLKFSHTAFSPNSTGTRRVRLDPGCLNEKDTFQVTWCTSFETGHLPPNSPVFM